MARDRDPSQESQSQLERWSARGSAVAAEAAADRERQAQENEKAERDQAAAEWERKARAPDQISQEVLTRLSHNLGGMSLYEAYARARRPLFVAIFAFSIVLATVVMLLPQAIRIPAGLISLLGFMAVFYALSHRLRKRAVEAYFEVAHRALAPWQAWASEQPMNIQHIGDLAYFSEGWSWYRLVLLFDPAAPRPDDKKVGAIITGLIDPIEPVEVQASLSTAVPEMRIDIYHRNRETVEPALMQKQVKLLVEQGLRALHNEHPLLAVRFGTLKRSIHR